MIESRGGLCWRHPWHGGLGCKALTLQAHPPPVNWTVRKIYPGWRDREGVADLVAANRKSLLRDLDGRGREKIMECFLRFGVQVKGH